MAVVCFATTNRLSLDEILATCFVQRERFKSNIRNTYQEIVTLSKKNRAKYKYFFLPFQTVSQNFS